MYRLASFAPVIMLCAAGNAAAGTMLWNQTGPNTTRYIDQSFTDFPDSSTFMVDDFTTAGQTWNLTSITGLYYGDMPGDLKNITTGTLTFYAKNGPLPSNADDPGQYTVPITLDGDWSSGYHITAVLHSISAFQGIKGDYWIGLAPVGAFLEDGAASHAMLTSGHFGSFAATRNPGNWNGNGGNWLDAGAFNGHESADMWFTLTGNVVPAPSALSVAAFGLVAGFRRRR